jgi:C1A family cysteine protease
MTISTTLSRRLKTGWRPDLPDQRDLHFAPRVSAKKLPALVDLQPAMPPVWNQGDIGSCVGHGIAAAHYCAQRMSGDSTPVVPSRLMVYYNGRVLDGTVKQDAGTYIRNAMKALAVLGVSAEKFWPYVERKWATKPTALAFTNALKHQALTYNRVDNTSAYALRAALAQGLPVVFGAMLYESFYNLVDGAVRLPDLSEQPIGGHCMLIVGYSDARSAFLVRNSWGREWGDEGYHWMPYTYVTSRQLCDDFWVLSTVEI